MGGEMYVFKKHLTLEVLYLCATSCHRLLFLEEGSDFP